jgi:sugar phosphate isomerase/epimerase
MLYTVRDDCARDLEGTLRAVAALGYEGVELYSLHGHETARVRAWLDELGLAAAGLHAGLDAIEGRLDALAAELGGLGSERLTLSWIEPPASAEGARRTAARIAAAAGRARELGLRLGFHNHAAELLPLDGDGTFLDLLLALPPELLDLELDLGWAWDAGVDPVALLERAHGRCPLVHVKDFRTRGERAFCPVDEGAVPYERVLPAAIRAGAEWLLVEQDECEGSALDAAASSLAAVRHLLAESG